MAKNPTKKDLKKLIEKADFLTPKNKKEWFEIIKHLSTADLKSTYNYFAESIKNENDFKLMLIHKSNSGNDLLNEAKKISDDAIKHAILKK